MTRNEFADRLHRRAAAAGITLLPDTAEKLGGYFELLARWNARINLTALPLDSPTDLTIDRLFIEPLAASIALTNLPGIVWFDLGSGGGSPAVPLAVTRGELQLTMVEVRQKKAAFLREVVRVLGLNAAVDSRRYEDVALARTATAALVTSRAVRTSPAFWRAVERLLVSEGVVAIFGSEPSADMSEAFKWLPRVDLAAGPGSHLIRGKRVPRETLG